MNSLNNDEINKINKLRQKLYSRSLNNNVSKLNPLHKHNIDIPTSWGEKIEVAPNNQVENFVPSKGGNETVSDFLNKKKFNNSSELYPNLIKNNNYNNTQELRVEEKGKKMSFTFGFIIFMITFFFFVGAVFYAYINLSQGKNIISTSKIDIKITGPVSVKSGEVNDFVVDITNNNTTDLILSDLLIQYPTGSKSPLDRNKDLNNERVSIGTIRPGETIRQKTSVIFFGEQNVKKTIKYSYEFNINDSATLFKTEKDVGVFIVGSPVLITVNNINEINNNQELTFDIKIESNTEEVLKNLQLRVEYPFGYKLLESNPKPYSDNNTWSFDSLEALSSTTIKLKGKFIGEVNVDKNFRFILGIEDKETKEMLTVLSTQDSLVEIRKPFVVTKLLIDGYDLENTPVSYDQILKSDLVITNTLTESITDVIVEVFLSGVLIDRTSVSSNDGFFDSNRDMILWDNSLNKGLLNIPPGESREFSFNMAIIKSSESLIKTLKLATSDITINVKAQRLGENRVNENIVASTKKQLRLKTDVLFNSNLAYDSGAFAPEVNKETVFTYIGNISNTANSIKAVEFKAKLPPNSAWKNVYSPNIPTNSIKYNQSTREITINLGDVESGTGITKPSKDFYFKIGFTPTLTQTSQSPVTIIDPTITTTDSFTGEKISIKNNSMTTSVTTGINAGLDSKVK